MKITIMTTEIEKNSQILLSTDDSKNINFIVGQNATSKSHLFNKIKQFFINPEVENDIKIDTTNNDGFNLDLMFVDDNILHTNILESGSFDKELPDILNKGNEILKKIGGVFEYEGNLLKLNNHKIETPSNLAAGPTIMLNYAILLAVRNKISPNTPLIIDDGGFSRLTPEFTKKLFKIFSENVNQSLIFVTDTFLFSQIHNTESQSAYDTLENEHMLGSVYVMKLTGIVRYVRN